MDTSGVSLKEYWKDYNMAGVSLKEYWKDYNILKGLDNIKMVWEEVNVLCMKGM